mmetsp:Transcript_72693/g.144411  ORF Transcript_72693/g.144411 Transcript_72693/m.144411 type:complete len:89 (-) Transcript_72693:132-398(-)
MLAVTLTLPFIQGTPDKAKNTLDKLKDGQRRAVVGHTAVGGTIGFCVPERKVAVAITVSRLTGQRSAVKKLLELLLGEVGLGLPSGLT